MALAVGDLPEVWCLDCKHPHVATIPSRTWDCLNCPFGSWDQSTVPMHSKRWPRHIIVAKDHHTQPLRPGTA